MDASTLTRPERLRSILGGSAGNLVEWYDWYVYSAFTLYFAPAIFPKANATAQLLNAAAIFAVGFLMRPVGAWVMGVYSDRHVRKAGLTLSVTLMCAGSLLIAATPSYATAGALAPAMLVVARVMQGLSVGGEYGASATYLSEMAGARHRGFWASFQYVTLIGGQLAALAVLIGLQAWLSEAELEAWGWRVPFVIGGALALAVFRLRRGLAETPDFKRAEGDRSGAALFRDHPRAAWTVMALTAGGTLAFYAYTTYMQKFLVNTGGFDRVTASRIMTAALLVYAAVQPLAGALSDRVGRRPLLIGFGIAGVAGTVPLFLALENIGERTGNALAAWALVTAALVALSGYTAISGLVKAEMFPANVRALGVAFPYAVANTAFGGTAEWLALRLKAAGVERGFYWYVTAVIAVSLVTFWRMADPRDAKRIADN